MLFIYVILHYVYSSPYTYALPQRVYPKDIALIFFGLAILERVPISSCILLTNAYYPTA